MDILDTIRYLNSPDGPHMPLRAIAPYCGIEHGALSQYLNGKMKPKPETIERMKQGIRELVNEIWRECKWLHT